MDTCVYSAVELNHMLISYNRLLSRHSTGQKEPLLKNKELSRQMERDRTTCVHTTLGMWTTREGQVMGMSQSVQCGQKGTIRQEFLAENGQM